MPRQRRKVENHHENDQRLKEEVEGLQVCVFAGLFSIKEDEKYLRLNPDELEPPKYHLPFLDFQNCLENQMLEISGKGKLKRLKETEAVKKAELKVRMAKNLEKRKKRKKETDHEHHKKEVKAIKAEQEIRNPRVQFSAYKPQQERRKKNRFFED